MGVRSGGSGTLEEPFTWNTAGRAPVLLPDVGAALRSQGALDASLSSVPARFGLVLGSSFGAPPGAAAAAAAEVSVPRSLVGAVRCSRAAPCPVRGSVAEPRSPREHRACPPRAARCREQRPEGRRLRAGPGERRRARTAIGVGAGGWRDPVPGGIARVRRAEGDLPRCCRGRWGVFPRSVSPPGSRSLSFSIVIVHGTSVPLHPIGFMGFRL